MEGEHYTLFVRGTRQCPIYVDNTHPNLLWTTQFCQQTVIAVLYTRTARLRNNHRRPQTVSSSRERHTRFPPTVDIDSRMHILEALEAISERNPMTMASHFLQIQRDFNEMKTSKKLVQCALKPLQLEMLLDIYSACINFIKIALING